MRTRTPLSRETTRRRARARGGAARHLFTYRRSSSRVLQTTRESGSRRSSARATCARPSWKSCAVLAPPCAACAAESDSSARRTAPRPRSPQETRSLYTLLRGLECLFEHVRLVSLSLSLSRRRRRQRDAGRAPCARRWAVARTPPSRSNRPPPCESARRGAMCIFSLQKER